MWHILTSSKYTWSPKQIPEIERDTQEETQPLELTHRLTHVCCQIPPLSPAGLSYDQQCYQWFTGKLNCFMDTYPVLLVKPLRLLIQLRNGHWVTDLCPTPTAFSVTQMVDQTWICGGEIVIKIEWVDVSIPVAESPPVYLIQLLESVFGIMCIC